MILKQCPFWVLAALQPNYNDGERPLPVLTFNQALVEHFNAFNCKGERCQMWDKTTEDCGLKRSNDLKSSESDKDEHSEEEKQFLTPEERNRIHPRFSEDAVKYNQDTWSCPE